MLYFTLPTSIYKHDSTALLHPFFSPNTVLICFFSQNIRLRYENVVIYYARCLEGYTAIIGGKTPGQLHYNFYIPGVNLLVFPGFYPGYRLVR